MRKSKASIAEAVENLKKFVKPGDTVYTIIRHVSASGMSRVIDPIVFKDDYPRYLGGMCLNADLGRTPSGDRYSGVQMNGCGTDMCFELVYNIGRVCFPEGFGTPCVHCGYRAPDKATALANQVRTEDEALPVNVCRAGANRSLEHEFRGRNGDTSGWDTDGGYALKSVRL